MRALIPLIAVAAALSACAGPSVVNETPPGVSYRISGNNVAEANQRADRYCQQYGKRARLQGLQRAGSDNIAVYECS
jgi:hypothetical protein